MFCLNAPLYGPFVWEGTRSDFMLSAFDFLFNHLLVRDSMRGLLDASEAMDIHLKGSWPSIPTEQRDGSFETHSVCSLDQKQLRKSQLENIN